ncbi:MAG: 6-pyruvoyl-tetrahydropterin synthase-related protein [Blastocatellales bacterium]
MSDMDEKSGVRLIVAAAIWLAISLLMTLPRITHPAYGIQGDLTLHYHITRTYERSLSEGDLIPRWAGLLDGGRGDALFTFYPPLTYALGAFGIRFLGLNLLGTLKLIMFLTLFAAQASAWVLAREFTSRRRSLIASILYVVLPAFPLIAFNRSFLANAVGLAIAPLAIAGAKRLLTGTRTESGLILFLISSSLLVLTHAITTYLTGLTIGLMALGLWRQAGWRGWLRLGGAGLAALALTAFFLWPQVVERNWVQLGLQVVQHGYKNYFLFAESDAASEYRKAWAGVNDVYSIVILCQTTTLLLLGAIVLGYLSRGGERGAPEAGRVGWFSLLVACFGLLISLPLSEPLWRYLPGLKFIQFPWRYLPFVSLLTGIAAVSAMAEWSGLRRRPRVIAAAFLTWMVIFNGVFTFMFVRLNEPGLTRERVAELLEGRGAKPLSLDEGRKIQNEDDLQYTAYAANQIYFRPHGTEPVLYPPANEPGGIEVIEGTGEAGLVKNRISHREYGLESGSAVRLRILTHAYPHWVARLDGREIPIAKEPETGLMIVEAPAGKHNLTLDFEIRDPGERAARWISLLAWVGLAGWIVRTGLKPSR